MNSVIIVGDGPAGLSAALYLAKLGAEVTVYGQDETQMHSALLRNYLGIEEETGTSFQQRARAQVAGFGARLVDAEVVELSDEGDRVRVVAEGHGEDHADYLILAGGKKGVALAEQLGLGLAEAGGVKVDDQYRSTSDRVYVVGRSARLTRSQAIISAGAGAVAALDILSREKGADVKDWERPVED